VSIVGVVEQWPSVSVVMPVRNEAANIESAIDAILAQEYHGDLDVWVAVGPSTDATAEVVDAIAARDTRVHRVDNPAGVTPAALNVAIAASAGEVIVRVDGHSELCENYIAMAVETLRCTGAVNVGGVQNAVGRTRIERSIATVMMSRVGSGGVAYRSQAAAGPVDTVYLGVFDRAAGDAVGWFDERLIRNQDYEFNIRLRDAGGVVWFDPRLSVTYHPRSSVRSFARQYYEYGCWKAVVLRMHRSSLRLRQVIPPVVSSVVTLALAAALVAPAALVLPVAYVLAIGALTPGNVSQRLAVMSLAPVMHVSWSAGLLRGIVRPVLTVS